MTFLRRTLVAGIVAAMSTVPMADLASAKKSGDDTCTSRGANKGGTCNNNTSGGGGSSGGNNTGQKNDECDNRTDGVYLVGGGVYVTCNNFDVVDVNVG